MLGQIRGNRADLIYLLQVEEWTRKRFSLSEDDIVLVSQVRSNVLGCPEFETVVAFWSDNETRYRFKIFKPVARIVESDLPVHWLLSALRDYGDLDCC